ncbi:MAG: hypothetical protein A2Z66_10040 [Chloroflexi bacterium RBG_13_66_10]|nr:MAG: hypothetical protein A2Z66_10040 [Chloroflexi bacterium RBG_13_66_10]
MRGKTARPRPYWHVDAKWVTSLFLVPILGATLLTNTLAQITAEGPAVETVSLLLGVMFSGGGLDEETDVATFRERLQADPDGCIQPIDSIRIDVCEEEIAGLSPREARLFLFRQLAQPLYEQGADGLMALAVDPETEQSMAQGIGPLSLFTLATHQAIQRVLGILAVVCAVLFIPLILFSYRFGRIGSPGLAIIAAACPGLSLFGFFAFVFNPPAASAAEPGMAELAGALVTNVLPSIARTAVPSYFYVAALGVLLVLAATLGTIAARMRRPPSPALEAEKALPPI